MRGYMRVVLFALIALCAITTSADARRSHTIKVGDTPDAIRFLFTPSLDELRAANPKIDFAILHIGDTVVDPRPEPKDILEAELAKQGIETKLSSIIIRHDKLINELVESNAMVARLKAESKLLTIAADEGALYGIVLNALAVILAIIICVLFWTIVSLRGADRKILLMQKELAQTRNDNVLSMARSVKLRSV